jgi:glycosyltransferase involved in cell wall biosynthesis
VPGIASKHLDTITHTAVSCLDSVVRPYDVVTMCISGNSPLAVLPRMAGAKVVLNVDGSDWRRRKWRAPARTYIKLSEWLATRLAHAVVTDSEVMYRYYKERFNVETTCIAYGADVAPPWQEGMLSQLGLQPRGYFLLVGRLVPENCAHHLVEAFEQLDTDLKCVVVGDAPYVQSYIADLKRKGPRVIFPGYVFGDGYRELMRNAYATVLCSEVGGTHPVLIEAMSAGNCAVVNNTPANLEVIGDCGLSYEGRNGASSLRDVLEHLIAHPDEVARYRELARARAESRFSWEAVTDQYEELFDRLVRGRVVVAPTGAIER